MENYCCRHCEHYKKQFFYNKWHYKCARSGVPINPDYLAGDCPYFLLKLIYFV
jgi:hypothetical protein